MEGYSSLPMCVCVCMSSVCCHLISTTVRSCYILSISSYKQKAAAESAFLYSAIIDSTLSCGPGLS